MPYVSESRTSPAMDVKIYRDGVNTETYTTLPALSKSQYGYRSGPLSQVEKDAINHYLNDSTHRRGETLSVAAAIEKVESITTQTPRVNGRPSVVNDRIYSESRQPVCTIETDYQEWPWGYTRPYGRVIRQQGCVQAVIADSFVFADPDRGKLDYHATQLMRSMRPTKPDFELARFVGELKDVPQFWNKSNYAPLKVSEVGGSYLNAVFGILPTWSDLNSASKAVLQSDQILRDFALKATQTVKRSRTSVLDTGTYTAPRRYLLGGISNSVDYGHFNMFGNLGGGSYSTYEIGTYFDAVLDKRRELRVFADFEYYIGDPEGFLGRIDSYRDKARKILGTGVSPGTVYDLTPWSWLGNWFFDFGSLLKYQQDVADNGLVARNSGYLVEDRINLIAQFQKFSSEGSGTRLVSTNPVTATLKKQWRWAGSPYSMSPNWDLSGFQWAIVGALGFTKAPKVPFLRNIT